MIQKYINIFKTLLCVGLFFLSNTSNATKLKSLTKKYNLLSYQEQKLTEKSFLSTKSKNSFEILKKDKRQGITCIIKQINVLPLITKTNNVIELEESLDNFSEEQDKSFKLEEDFSESE